VQNLLEMLSLLFVPGAVLLLVRRLNLRNTGGELPERAVAPALR
jgi:hypothetical protein